MNVEKLRHSRNQEEAAKTSDIARLANMLMTEFKKLSRTAALKEALCLQTQYGLGLTLAKPPRKRATNINQILAQEDRSSERGAPLGGGGSNSALPTGKLMVQRVTFVDYDYARDGTYWGGGGKTLPLWCAFDPNGAFRQYVRASSRTGALQAIDKLWRNRFPDIAFYKDKR